jgi:hypothetical protein
MGFFSKTCCKNTSPRSCTDGARAFLKLSESRRPVSRSGDALVRAFMTDTGASMVKSSALADYDEEVWDKLKSFWLRLRGRGLQKTGPVPLMNSPKGTS